VALVTLGRGAGHGLLAWAWAGPAVLCGAQVALVRALERQAGSRRA
jgi:hypothetical protein